MKYLSLIGLILGILSIFGCNQNEETSDEITLYINHYKSECGSFELALCMRSKVSLNDDWGNFYDPIKEFKYEWGYVYKIKVRIEDVENPPEDVSSKKYTLLEIVEKVKEPVTSFFDISASRASGLVLKKSEEIYEVYNDKNFSCVAADCETIDSLINQDMAILFEFHHQADPDLPLFLTQIKCSSSREAFRDSCL